MTDFLTAYPAILEKEKRKKKKTLKTKKILHSSKEWKIVYP